eukprot:CFRG4643T1
MRIKAEVGDRTFVVPVRDETRTIQWLIDECLRRSGHYSDSPDQNTNTEAKKCKLYTQDGYELFRDDSIMDVLSNDDCVSVLKEELSMTTATPMPANRRVVCGDSVISTHATSVSTETELRTLPESLPESTLTHTQPHQRKHVPIHLRKARLWTTQYSLSSPELANSNFNVPNSMSSIHPPCNPSTITSRKKNFRILLVRHGVSTANLDPSVYEHTPDHRIPLAPEGKTMARKAGDAISKYLYEVFKDPALAGHIRMWYSPYQRTVQTAEAIRDSCGQWITDARENPMIAEIDYGLFEGRGRSFAQDLGMQKELTHYNLRAMHSGRFWARFPMGESPFDVCQRVAMFNGTIIRDRDMRADSKPPIETIIVVSHGITLRVFMKMWCHKSHDWYEDEWNGNNCSVRLVTSSGDNGYIFNGFNAHDCNNEASSPSSYSKLMSCREKKELKTRRSFILANDDPPCTSQHEKLRSAASLASHSSFTMKQSNTNTSINECANSNSNVESTRNQFTNGEEFIFGNNKNKCETEMAGRQKSQQSIMDVRRSSLPGLGHRMPSCESCGGMKEKCMGVGGVAWGDPSGSGLGIGVCTDIGIDIFSSSSGGNGSGDYMNDSEYQRSKSHQERRTTPKPTRECDLLRAASEMLPPDSDVEIRYSEGTGVENRPLSE